MDHHLRLKFLLRVAMRGKRLKVSADSKTPEVLLRQNISPEKPQTQWNKEAIERGPIQGTKKKTTTLMHQSST
jgi:hypothetical protein